MKRRRSSVASDGEGSRITSVVSAIERRLTFAWTTCMTEDKTEIQAKQGKRYLVNFHILILSLNSKCYCISPDLHPARGCRCTGRELNELSHHCMGVRHEKPMEKFQAAGFWPRLGLTGFQSKYSKEQSPTSDISTPSGFVQTGEKRIGR
ncbi:uncharacterized [Tachysurus ichikawai]